MKQRKDTLVKVSLDIYPQVVWRSGFPRIHLQLIPYEKHFRRGPREYKYLHYRNYTMEGAAFEVLSELLLGKGYFFSIQ